MSSRSIFSLPISRFRTEISLTKRTSERTMVSENSMSPNDFFCPLAIIYPYAKRHQFRLFTTTGKSLCKKTCHSDSIHPSLIHSGSSNWFSCSCRLFCSSPTISTYLQPDRTTKGHESAVGVGYLFRCTTGCTALRTTIDDRRMRFWRVNRPGQRQE